MPPVQTTYLTTIPDGIPGQIADISPLKIQSGIVEAAAGLAAGLLVFHGATEQAVRAPATTDAVAASATAILATGGATTGGAQNFTGGALNGTIGAGTMFPARNITLTLNNHANWLASTIVVSGLDANGFPQTENFSVPAGGNVTLTGEKLFTSVTNIAVPAQGGTNGTFTAGTGSLIGGVQNRVAGITVYTPARMPVVYAQKDMVPVMRVGSIYVKSETATNRGDPVYARFIASGAQVLGEMRATPDGNNCARIPGLQFGRKVSAAGISVVEINLPA
jgi:hypothetical protein